MANDCPQPRMQHGSYDYCESSAANSRADASHSHLQRTRRRQITSNESNSHYRVGGAKVCISHGGTPPDLPRGEKITL